MFLEENYHILPFKTCTLCKRSKPLDQFSPNGGNRAGRRSRCKPCRSKYEYSISDRERKNEIRRKGFRPSPKARREYAAHEPFYRRGLTTQEYEELVQNQKGCCLICDQPTKSLHVDHCHVTGDIRGLLCGNCNRALGMFRDQVDLLERAIKYLKGESS